MAALMLSMAADKAGFLVNGSIPGTFMFLLAAAVSFGIAFYILNKECGPTQF